MDRSFLFEGKHFFKNNLKVQLSVSEENPFMMLHRHDFVELAYVYEGRGLHKIGDQIMLVSQGDLFIIRPGVPHVFQPLDLTGHRPLKVDVKLGAINHTSSPHALLYLNSIESEQE